MKKLLSIISVVLFGLFTANLAFAANEPAATAKAQAENQSNYIYLYKSASASDLLKKLNPNVRLVPIYQQGNWAKVGDPQNGQVGWINLVQYQKARARYYRPNIQTIYVQVDTSGKGKPTLNVVAYKNGKALTKEQAMGLYQRLRKQQERQFHHMQKFSMNMEQMMNQDFLNAQHFFDSAWMNSPWMEPVILVPAPKAQNNATPSKPAKKSS